MSRFTRFIGFVWASPLTLLGLLYVTAFTALGWFRSSGCHGDACVWLLVPERAPRWVCHKALYHGGQTLGNIIVLRHGLDTVHGQTVLRHEQEHVHQMMTMGPFYPLFYVLGVLMLMCTRSGHSFYDHPLEVDCRRAAGQTVDVIGAVQKAIGQGKLLKKRD